MLGTITRACSGDTAACEALARALTPRVDSCSRYYARRSGVDEDDLRQEMWVGIFAALGRVDARKGDPMRYLVAQGRYALLSHLRGTDPEWTPLALPDEIEGGPSVEAEVLDSHMTERALDYLDEAGRIIVCYLLQGHTRSDAARLLGCTPANITYHLRRAQRGLSAAFEQGGTLSCHD